MRTVKFGAIIIAFVATVFHLSAQDSPWFFVAYMKSKPGMYDEYVACEKVWKTIHQERVRLGKIGSWSLYEVMFPGGTATEYDFVIIQELIGGWNGIESSNTGWEEVQKIITPEMQKVVDNTENTRDMVKYEVWQGLDAVFGEGEGPANYQIVNYMHVPRENWNAYWDMETTLVKPVHKLNIDAGKRLGWGVYGLVLPYSENAEYAYATVDFYAKWSDIGSSVENAWQTVHPGMTQALINERILGSRTLVSQQVLRLIDATQ